MKFGERIKKFYESNHKILLVIPTILIILSISQIIFQVSTTGDFIKRGVSLTGGVEFEFQTDEVISVNELEKHLKSELPEVDFSIRVLSSGGVQSSILMSINRQNNLETLFNDTLTSIKEKVNVVSNTSPTLTSSSLGESFFRQTFKALFWAFLFIAIVVYAYFRVLVPSGFIVLTLLSDIITTLAIVNILGMTISLAGIVAFLMLIGYSVDTDILLTSRILKSKTGNIYSRLLFAMKTGWMMVITTLSAVSVALLITTSIFIKELMTIVLIGLLVDLVFTWLQNAPILLYYLEHKKVKH